MSEDARLRLAFADLRPGVAARLVDEHGPAEALRRTSAGSKPALREQLTVPAAQRRATLQDLGVDLVFRGEPGYPDPLQRIADPPLALFLRGSYPTQPAVAVVGTRRCTGYGRGLAHEYGRAISDAGWVVVSGLARGIDGAAHRGMVAAGGVGVVVLGCGIDVTYPAEHGSLAAEIVASGGVVCTEYPPGTPPEG